MCSKYDNFNKTSELNDDEFRFVADKSKLSVTCDRSWSVSYVFELQAGCHSTFRRSKESLSMKCTWVH